MPRILVVLAAVILWLDPAAGRAQHSPAETGRPGVALVIGNETYADLPDVPGATADVAAVSVYLRQSGFDVLQYVNLTQGELLAASQRFIGRLRPGMVAVVYFAGHVVQYDGNNYLLPTNARLDRPTAIFSVGMPLNTLIRRVDEAELASALYFLEAGLSIDPTGDGTFANGMAEPPPTRVPSVFAFAVEPDRSIPLADPTLGDFTAEVLAQATLAGASLREVLMAARDRLAVIRGNRPAPWVRLTLDAPLVMVPRQQQTEIHPAEQRIWDAIAEEDSETDRLTAIRLYLHLYPDGAYAAAAREMQAALEAAIARGAAEAAATTEGDGDAAAGNRPPQFDAPAVVRLAPGDAAVPLNLPAPVDPEGEALTIAVTALPSAVTVLHEGAPLAVGDSLRPEALDALTAVPAGDGASGGEPLQLTVSDASGGSVTASIRFETGPAAVANRPPVALDLAAVAIPSDAGPQTLAIPAPSDPDGDPLVIVVAGLPKFGEILADGVVVFEGQELTVDALATLAYAPYPGQSGDAGALALAVRDPHGNEVSFSQPITVTPAPTEAGAAPWDAAAAAADDLLMAQRALQALGLYSGSLDGVFGRGSQAAIARYQASVGLAQTGALTARERAELAVAGAQAVAEAARAVAAEAEAAAARALEIAHGEEAEELSWADGIYRGQVSLEGEAPSLEGYGVLQAANGQSFAGLFEDNQPKLGVHQFQSDSRYAGEERDRVPQGLGVYSYPSGVVFAGQWERGHINGLGVSESPQGVIVAGEWAENAPNGYGAVTDNANGHRVGRMEGGRFTDTY